MKTSPSKPSAVPVRVLLADDHEQTRAGLRRQLERSERIVVVGEVADGPGVLMVVEQIPAEVLLLDIDLPQMKGPRVMKRLREAGMTIPVLGLSNYTDLAYVFEMLAYGAAGYLSKEDSTEIIIEAVCCVARGARCKLSPSLWTMLKQRTALPPSASLLKEVPSRDREVVSLLAAGYPNEQIARLLQMPVKEIEALVGRLCDAFAFLDRAELVAWGWEQGLVNPSPYKKNQRP